MNDTYGHQAGDAVLKRLGETLAASVRTNDFAARYGGEEFVVYMPQTPIEAALKSSERLRRRIERQVFDHNGTEFTVTVSIGVSTRPEKNIRPSDLFERADESLYLAKQSGRNQIWYWNANRGKNERYAGQTLGNDSTRT